MSAPRPYKTDPLHPPSSVRARYHGKFQYIYQTVPVIVFHMVFTICLGKLYVCHLRMHFFPEPLITRFQRNFELILSSTYNALVRDTARHCHYKLDLYTVASQHGVTAVNVRMMRVYELTITELTPKLRINTLLD